MIVSRRFSRFGLCLAATCLLLTAGCSGSLPGAALLTPPALRTEIAAQTAAAQGQSLPTFEIVAPTEPLTTQSTSDLANTPSPQPQPTQTTTLEVVPTQGLTPTNTTWWRRTPTPTATPKPAQAALFIKRPGLYSKVTSPLSVSADAVPGANGLVWVELIGEDGRNLFQTRLNFSGYTADTVSLSVDIPFELTAPAELARLIVSTRDRLGRISALTSTEVILIQMGNDQVYPSGYDREPYIIRSPREGQIIRGGLLGITALARPVNENPLIVELLDEQGAVLASTSLELIFPTGDLSHTPFDILLTYTVSQSTNARLVIRQESASRIPGTVALTSLELTLQP